MSFNLISILRDNVKSLTPYRCARDDYQEGVLLDANESPFNLNLEQNNEITALYKDKDSILQLNRYPDPYQIELKKAIIEKINNDFVTSPEQLFLGVGSDEIIDLILRLVGRPGQDKILITPPTYGMYQFYGHLNGLEILKVGLDKEFQLNMEKMLLTINDNLETLKVIFLCHPGNPTGTFLKLTDIETLLNSNYKGLIVVDEAYIHYHSKQSTIHLLKNYDNLIILNTFSKAYSLAGIRLGIAFASKLIIHYLNCIKSPYNINILTIEAGLKALKTQTYAQIQENINEIKTSQLELKENLLKLPGILKILDKQHANFLMVQIHDKDGKPSSERAKKIYKYCAEELQVIIRYRGDELHCEGALRITVGTKEENKTVLEALTKALELFK